mgnify:FL=1
MNWRQERTILFEERRFGRFGDIVDLARLASADSGELLNSKQIEQVDFLGLAASRVHFIAFQSHVQSFSASINSVQSVLFFVLLERQFTRWLALLLGDGRDV